MIRENALDLPKAGFSVQDMTRMAICLAFCCVTAFITFPLPFTPGLVTALTIGISLTALVLPPKLAFITIAAYLFLGAVGLPIYPGGVGGLGRLMGPTAGFYFGWPIVCFLQSYFKGKAINFLRYAMVTVLIGVPLTYVGGLISMMVVLKVGFYEGLMLAVVPFLFGDVLKALLAAWLGVKVNQIIKR